jgi:hypothetical protein
MRLTCLLVLVGAIAIHAAPAANTAADEPLSIVVFSASVFGSIPGAAASDDQVSIVYPKVLSFADVQKDCISYNVLTRKPLTVHAIDNDPVISGEGNVISSAKTSVSFTANQIIQPGGSYFDVAPFILTYKRYKNIDIQFAPGANFKFTGLRTYRDRYLSVDLVPNASGSGSAYAYNIHIFDPSFTALNLPTRQATPEEVQLAKIREAERERNIKIFMGVLFAVFISLFIGYFAYRKALARSKNSKPASKLIHGR